MNVRDAGVAGLDDGTRDQSLAARFARVRATTERLCEPLESEDYVVQAIPDASPAKWHLAHTSWFFENFVLVPFARDYPVYHPRFSYLFNSYYETVGTFFPRPLRGHLSRPTVDEVYRYRAHVDRHLEALLAGDGERPEIAARVELGLHHEAQHQELIVTDIKSLFAMNPLRPAYRSVPAAPDAATPDAAALEAAAPDAGPGAADSGAPQHGPWHRVEAGVQEVGADGTAFCFDNELPRHRVYSAGAELSAHTVSNAEYLAFIDDGGYQRPELWLSEGWKAVKERGWDAPLYWERIAGEWWHYTLAGMRKVAAAEPVCHVSYYEADAYARWAGLRLPTEAEWEIAASAMPVAGNFLDAARLHPRAASRGSWYGDVWTWTRSAYAPYPGSVPTAGALGEYNAKFMVNQLVLRGGSCASPAWHIRPTYRNFFYGPDRWQFTGIRLARDLPR